MLGGVITDSELRNSSYSWQLAYMEGLGEHFDASLSYLNEGHIPLHHRDGIAVQLWARTDLLDRRLALLAGIGPYFYCDTTKASANSSFSDDHGLGAMLSLAANWYTNSPLFFQLRTNWVKASNGNDTLSAIGGIGYQLDSPSTTRPPTKIIPYQEKTTLNEITLLAGESILNSFGSENSLAASVEFRRSLWRYVDWTVAWLYEGDNQLIRRNGLASQFWLVNEFFGDRLSIGVGGGAYFAFQRRRHLREDEDDSSLSGIVTLTGSYRFHPHWAMRISWNRIVTNYNEDSDVILGGIGYLF